ncbi:MAG: hypothetical protein L6V81_01340 [Clostridium sp.]|nr:MAG: hypothetical protein L6V81_01340 [Clostridium sp.]
MVKVMTTQKDLMYKQRNMILDTPTVKTLFDRIVPSYTDYLVNNCSLDEINSSLDGIIDTKGLDTTSKRKFKRINKFTCTFKDKRKYIT